ncbi:glycerophosphodiester phosphodiesterase family protein [Hyphomonas sp.]|uniref:glycerophosphodiester phosphodiesterase family protein n=1 Tax=Hyphomonas sp. TaxID=87 RepID=UPI00391C1D01
MARPFDLKRFAYAHRGLWAEGGAPENSMTAFRAAGAAGLGIELDLRPSAEGEVMIFHDTVLGRMTGQDGAFEDMPVSALADLRLDGTGDGVPRFEDLLAEWPADLPMLAEMKIDGSTDPAAFAAQVAAMLNAWNGAAAAMSFSEAAVRALPESLMRGQLIAPVFHAGEDRFRAVAARALADGIPYLAVHYTDMTLAAEITEDRGTALAVWTLRSEADLAAVRPFSPALIFEHFDPALAVGATAP